MTGARNCEPSQNCCDRSTQTNEKAADSLRPETAGCASSTTRRKTILSLLVVAGALGLAGLSASKGSTNTAKLDSASTGTPSDDRAQGLTSPAALPALLIEHDVVFVLAGGPEPLPNHLRNRVSSLAERLESRGTSALAVTLDFEAPGFAAWTAQHGIKRLPSVLVSGAGCSRSVSVSGDLSTRALIEAYATASSGSNETCDRQTGARCGSASDCSCSCRGKANSG